MLFFKASKTVLLSLTVLLVTLSVVSLNIGAIDTSIGTIVSALLLDIHPSISFVVYEIRLPRLLVGVMVGASLAMSGAALQGLFRNPLADPGLIGVSSGAALGAVTIIVLGESWFSQYVVFWGYFALPLAAFIGGSLVTLLVYKVATKSGNTDMSLLLLTGIAIGTLAGAATGLLTYFASDEELRSLTFWTMGSIASASWQSVLMVLPATMMALIVLPIHAKALNAMMMGEANAYQMGHNTHRLKQIIIVFVALAVGSSVAMSGIIGFVGLVAPHLVRLLIGSDNRYVLIGSALVGASLLLVADMIARTAVAPAEIPLGIPMSLIGGIFFVWLLLGRKKRSGL